MWFVIRIDNDRRHESGQNVSTILIQTYQIKAQVKPKHIRFVEFTLCGSASLILDQQSETTCVCAHTTVNI